MTWPVKATRDGQDVPMSAALWAMAHMLRDNAQTATNGGNVLAAADLIESAAERLQAPS